MEHPGSLMFSTWWGREGDDVHTHTLDQAPHY